MSLSQKYFWSTIMKSYGHNINISTSLPFRVGPLESKFTVNHKLLKLQWKSNQYITKKIHRLLHKAKISMSHRKWFLLPHRYLGLSAKSHQHFKCATWENHHHSSAVTDPNNALVNFYGHRSPAEKLQSIEVKSIIKQKIDFPIW